MQPRALAALALLALAAPVCAVKVAEEAASSWLTEHPAPQGDELGELKNANPEAYAIVKALLTKRTLGLLDPKHPSASFAPASQQEAVPSGPEVFQAFASPASKSHIEYPDVPAAPLHHHNWLNWHPKDSAADDDNMVKSVLGAVADLKAGQAGKSLRGGSEGSSSEPSLEWGSANVDSADLKLSAKPMAQTSQPQAEAVDLAAKPAAASGENFYLKSAGFAVTGVAVAPKAAVPERKQDSTNYLSSFSWDDDSKAAKAKRAPKPEAAAQPAQKKNALLAWLGGSDSGAAVHKARVTTAAPAEDSNPYLSALQ